MVSPSLLSELDQILREDYGMAVSPSELVEIATALISIFELLAKMNISATT